MALPVPQIGSTVLYRLTQTDVDQIEPRLPPTYYGVRPEVGMLCASTVVNVLKPELGGQSPVNIQVLLDGPASHWVEGVFVDDTHEGQTPGRFFWRRRN